MDRDSDLDSEWSEQINSGANYADFARQLLYDRTDYMGNNSYYASYSTIVNPEPENTIIRFENPLPDDALKAYGKTKFETARKDVTSMFLIDSKNRDRQAYPQPTSFTLKPPRVYKNVTSIQVTQIKLLGSFFYFRAAKGNTFLPVIERGREAINNFLGFPLTYSVQLNEGSYSISQLLAALQIQMNYTPLFYDFPTGFAGFVNAFTANGDLSVNFNQPGDTYYDALNQKYITNPTMDQISSYYWGSRYAGLTLYTIDQVKVAYYYPVLYEVFLDTNDKTVYPYLNLNIPADLLSNNDTVYTHIIFNSSGLNDPIILYLINTNINLLDKYRLNHTFRYYLINRYQVAYDNNSLRVNFVTLTLNTSLINLINLTNSQNLTTTIQNAGLTTQQYANTSNSLNAAKVVFADMYNYIQSQLTKYFAIGYATYASQYFINTSNILFIQNGLNALGVRKGYTTEYLTSGQSPIASTIALYSNSPGYWPNFTTENTYLEGGTSPFGGGINREGINPLISMTPYSIASSNFQFGLETIDTTNYFINTSRSTRSVDCLATIHPGQYTVFKFRSQVRQTLQVETLPLPYYYRFADYNQQGYIKGILDPNNSNVPEKYFSTAYQYLYQSTNSLMDSSNYSTVKLLDIASRPFDTAFLSSPVLNLNVQNNFAQVEFIAPWPPGVISTGLYAYNTTLSFIGVNSVSSNVSTNLGTNVQAYVYHDRAAFMADLATPYRRKENPLHYIASTFATTANTDLTFQISTFSGQRYYSIFRSSGLSFGNMTYRPVVYTDTNYIQIQTDYIDFSQYGNPNAASNLENLPFVQNYDPDYIQLPTASNLQGIDPSDPKYTINTSVQGTPIGYDISRVSNDLTDYRGYKSGQIGFVPNSAFRIDPINNFTFQAITPYNYNTKSYFGSNSENSILKPITNEVYNYKGTSSSQVKIVHWYDDFYIPKQADDTITTTNTIGFSSNVSSIQSYIRDYPVNENGIVQFGRGINAIGFLPTDGLYEISSFSFKSAIYPLSNISTTAEDPNTAIKYIGVFTGSYLASKFIAISSALTVLSFSKSQVFGPATQSNTPGFGVEYGTWYEYGFDPRFVASSNVKIVGYTQSATELVSYDSMYYMVPFNAAGSNITYTNLTGSLVPYPLSQTISVDSVYINQQTVKTIVGTTPQPSYVTPVPIEGADPAYGPQGLIPYTQSQYEQSQPIMTNSFGFRDFQYLVTNQYALFPFRTTFSNTRGRIQKEYAGLTTFMSEYDDKMYLVNSLSNFTNISNATTSFQGARYASSISTTISLHGGTTESIEFLLNPCTILNNYPYTGLSNIYSTVLFKNMDSDGDNSNITTRQFNIDLNVNTPYITAWLWGGGGGTWTGGTTATSNQMGGAGAYAKVRINIQTLATQYGVSTLYLVVGKGGNRDNVTFDFNGSIQGYEQPRYGGGGTSIIENNAVSGSNNIHIQGGGFTGIFLNSNLETALPLIIVGGGGAGGAYTMGGPGGFGITPIPLPIETYPLSNIVLNTFLYPKLSIASIYDLGNIYPIIMNPPIGYDVSRTPVFRQNNSTIALNYLIDGNKSTQYMPGRFTFNSGFIQGNYNFLNAPTAIFPRISTENRFAYESYEFTLQFASNVSSISKLRFLGGSPGYAILPSGFIVYNGKDKSQMLYSNSSWDPTGNTGAILLSNNYIPTRPDLLQVAQDLYITDTIRNTPNVTTGWVTCGVNLSQYDTIQYSLDGSNWANIRSQTGPGTPLTRTNAVVYADIASSNGGGYWYACGANTIMRSSNGLDWSSSEISSPYAGGSLNTLVVGSNCILAGANVSGSSNSILITENGTTWSNTSNAFTSPVTTMRNTTPILWAISPTASPSLKWSLTGQSWTNATNIYTGAEDIAYDGLTTYVVAVGAGAMPQNSPLIYGTSLTSNVPPSTWLPVTATNLANFTCNTVCYGNGLFVAGGSTTDGRSPVKWSSDGINWQDTDVIPMPSGALWNAIYQHNGDITQVHVPGTTLFPKKEGVPSGSHIYDIIINKITFNTTTNTFISMARGTSIFFNGSGNNHLSVMTSINGVNWILTQDGGYTNNFNGNGTYAAALSGDYGPLTIIPNLSTIYIEVQMIENGPPAMFEIEAYSPAQPLSEENIFNTVSNIYDTNLQTYWWPNEAEVSEYDINNYSFTVNFLKVQPLVSRLTIYTPYDSTRYFTGLTASLVRGGNPVYNNPSITPVNFQYDPENNVSYFDAIFIPALSSVTSIYLDFYKNTATSIIVNEIKAENDPNKPIIAMIPDTITFVAATNGNTNSAPGFPLTNMNDGKLRTYWSATPRPNPGYSIQCTYELNFHFNTPAPLINFIQFYTGEYVVGNAQYGISGVVVYTDSNKGSILYSNVITESYKSLGINQYGYQYFSFNIIPYENVSDIYIEFINNTVNSGTPIQINEINFIRIGLLLDTPAGYTGGRVTDMQRITVAGNLFDAGGGSNGVGGIGGGGLNTNSGGSGSNGSNGNNGPTIEGTSGLDGIYLRGGSPASAGEPANSVSYTQLLYGAGGGGGGYYGGGGGGIRSYNASGCNVYEGGAGGGGAGYFINAPNLITLLEYGVANPGNKITQTPSNYLPPGKNVQDSLIGSNLLVNYTNVLGYGAGGWQSKDSGLGAHGAIVLNFDAPTTIQPIGNARQRPAFVDGSLLTLFEAPISYASDIRTLPFTAYTDPIQYSPFSNFNWVWYQSYLSLTGSKLNPQTMMATTNRPVPPSIKYPSLPAIVYTTAQEQYSNISSFFNGALSSIATTPIIQGLQTSFEIFNQYFVNTSYTDPKYVEFTELYCLLDYLRKPANLLNPHVDSITSPLDRIFGGVPGIGYWANPFFTNVSYIGFDTGPSLAVPRGLSTIAKSSDKITAFYGLALEQNLSSGIYSVKDIMAYKPTLADASNYGSNWLKVTQFNEAYNIRILSNTYIASNLPAQPYTLKSAIGGNLPLFNYKVFTAPFPTVKNLDAAPIHMINDFQGQYCYLYTFQNSIAENLSTIHFTQIPLTSSIVQVNQPNITSLSNLASNIIGTVVSEYNRVGGTNTILNAVTQFGFNLEAEDPFTPLLRFSTGNLNYYNSYSSASPIRGSNLGKGLTDYIGNLFLADRLGNSNLYENVNTTKILGQPFSNQNMKIASPSHILGQYIAGNENPYYDFLVSRSKNIWQFQGTQNLSTIYGARLTSPYDFTVLTNFASQIFYPTHKIIMTQKGTGINPIQDTADVTTYPSYSRTQSFFYRNFTSLIQDISGQFAQEKSSNFAYADTEFSGYFFNSYLQNINMPASTDFENTNDDSFNYLAIRAYSPSESFKTLVRFYLPGRYDFGYISLTDLSNEVLTLQGNNNVNPEYLTVLGQFTSSFALSRVFGGTGLPGFSGSNISSVTFGSFLKQYSSIEGFINSNSGIVEKVTQGVLNGQKALITGDLQYIIPAYVATRERVYDPLEFSLPFSTVAQASNRTIEEYSMGYNLGFAQVDTGFNTNQRAGSFFKILDDYIYMKMNPEYNMNRLDISRQENLASSHDTQAESQLYNCKLILNNFGTYATTFVQNPVMFNPPIGKLDKLTFIWYDATGGVIDNAECEWSGGIQIVESMDIATNDSTIPKM